MIVAALALGRVWCTPCPLELANRIGHAIARRVGWPHTAIRGFVRAGWIGLVLYLVLQLLVTGVSLHRVPHFTAVLLIVLIAGAVLSGLVINTPRSFCRFFCPAGMLLSVYGRYTPLQLAVRDPSTCDRCISQDCTCQENRYRFDGRSCPSLLRPFRRDPSDGCVLCLQCVKVCPHHNMGFGPLEPQPPEGRRPLLKTPEAAFVLLALGFVAHEVIGEVRWLDSGFHRVAESLHRLAPSVPFGWFEALWFLGLFPLGIWGTTALVGRIAGHRSGLGPLLVAAATGAAPVVAAAHLAKAVAKLASWSPFLPLSLHDPKGMHTLQRLAEGSLAAPVTLVGPHLLGGVMLIATLVVTWRAWKWTESVPHELQVAARSGLVASALLFTSSLGAWVLPAL